MAEQYLKLDNGRTLAYAEAGNPASSLLVIVFHGALNVGDAPKKVNPTFARTDAHIVAPTIAGWGKTSPRLKDVPFSLNLLSDLSALIKHLHPNDANLKLAIMGGSYGTIAAQIVYGADFNTFPLGRNIVGCMIAGPFSPAKYHKDFAKAMTTANYISIGPPSQLIPFRLVQRLSAFIIGRSTKSIDDAEGFIQKNLFDKMDADEKARYAVWRQENDKSERQLERELASIVVRSVEETWDGFYEMSDVMHGDWGFNPRDLDEEHYVQRPIFIVSAEGDDMSPDAMAKWLAAEYHNSHSRSIKGGHLSALYVMDDLWKQFFELCGI
ncbi:hypothetical protein D9619_000765 [Psilocybe cf. subviscida]|uniref:AB hydrolase-1 domain-containing protein n=1 Tax=Psilocybe cf. subviscida TaxID=2480587 RepID=A0A8H5F2N0_9AGAR|nr:hypothetical protein D9619_000765 [Psilocybe cf. subviscida]